MFYLLWRAKRATVVQRTSNLLGRLIAIIIETCLACTAVAIASLLIFVMSRNTMIYVVPTVMIGKFYANALLAVGFFLPSVFSI